MSIRTDLTSWNGILLQCLKTRSCFFYYQIPSGEALFSVVVTVWKKKILYLHGYDEKIEEEISLARPAQMFSPLKKVSSHIAYAKQPLTEIVVIKNFLFFKQRNLDLFSAETATWKIFYTLQKAYRWKKTKLNEKTHPCWTF